MGSRSDGYSPIVYFNQGAFLLEAEGPGGSLVVRAGMRGGRPIIGYRDGHIVVSATGTDFSRYPFLIYGRPGVVAVEVVAPEADTGTRFSEDRFLSLIRKIAREQ